MGQQLPRLAMNSVISTAGAPNGKELARVRKHRGEDRQGNLNHMEAIGPKSRGNPREACDR